MVEADCRQVGDRQKKTTNPIVTSEGYSNPVVAVIDLKRHMERILDHVADGGPSAIRA